jgi:glycerophosphoryl diester phosphodiesterase
VRCIAHRGFAGRYTENTLPAVEAAAAAGADCIEVDVRRCGSGDLVVVHDDRLTDATGAVADTPLSTLVSLSVLDSGAGIPTLDAVFEAVPDDVALNLELKESGLAADTLAVADAHDNDVLVSSFERELLAAVQDHSDLPTALLFANSRPCGLPGASTVMRSTRSGDSVMPGSSTRLTGPGSR